MKGVVGLSGPESLVESFVAEELVVRAGLDDSALVQHDEVVTVGDGRETVCDEDARLIAGDFLEVAE